MDAKTFELGKYAGCEPSDVPTEDLGWIKRYTYSYEDRMLAAGEIARRRRACEERCANA